VCAFCGASYARHSSLAFHLKRRHSAKHNIVGIAATAAVTAAYSLQDLPGAVSTASLDKTKTTAHTSEPALNRVFPEGPVPPSLSNSPDSNNMESSCSIHTDQPSAGSPNGIISCVCLVEEGSVGTVSNDNNNDSSSVDVTSENVSSSPPTYLSMPVFLSLDSPDLWNQHHFPPNNSPLM
jgi:hypothetical protein